jgi:hypothetical protein
MKLSKIRYKNSSIQDIHFLISSDFLISKSEGIRMFPERLNRIIKNDLDILCEQLDHDNEILLKLEKAKQMRLGHYAEVLLSVYFHAHQSVTVLEQNWQLIRNGITIGELDFILKINDEIIGLETAFKCYIQYGPLLEDWEGPYRKDALVEKLHKVRERQLPLFESEEVKSIYGDIESFLFLKGHLFSNSEFDQTEELKSPDYQFLYQDEIEGLLSIDARFYLFGKPLWISGIQYSPRENEVKKEELLNEVNKNIDQKKSTILGVRNKKEFKNYMLLKRIVN